MKLSSVGTVLFAGTVLLKLGVICLGGQEAGTPSWTNHYQSADQRNTPFAIAAAEGIIAVAGNAANTNAVSDWVTIAYSSGGTALWTNSFNGSGDHDDAANAVAIDANGDVFVAGVSFAATTGQDFTAIKYSRAGAPLWTNSYNGVGVGGDAATAIALDATGNVVVTGLSVGPVGTSSYFDFATIKYSGAGIALWTNRYDGPAHNEDGATDVALDSSGNVFVTGTSFNAQGNSDFLTIGYTSTGAAMWTNRYNGPGNNSDFARAVAVDHSGNVFVTGDSWGGSATDYATIKYSAAGATMWIRRYHGSSMKNNFATAIAVDTAGNVFVTGSDGGFQSTNGGYATIKYSNDGTALWTNHYNGAVIALGFNDNGRAIALDKLGNVLVTGQSYRDFVTTDMATVAYSNSGSPLWTNRYNSPINGNDTPLTKRSLAVGSNGDVYVTGVSASEDADGSDFVTIKYATLAPLLRVARSDGVVILSWGTNAPNFQLWQNENLSPNSWQRVTEAPATNESNIAVTVPANADRKFFRLESP